MSYQDQPEQNPSVPRNYHRTGTRGGDGFGSCLCDCLCCNLPKCLCECGCCLLGCVFEIIFSILSTVIVIVGLIILILWLVVQPHGLKFKVMDAALTTFNFNTDNNTNTLNFDLAVNLTVRNPNRRMGVYYNDIQANFNYGLHRLKTVEAVTFYQGHKNTSSLGTLVFKGQNVVILGSDEKLKFDKQSKDGLYEIQVKFHLKVKFKVGIIKSGTWKPKVKCNLKVPLLGKSSQIFQETKCHYYF